MSFSTYSKPKSGKELYYWRLDAWLETIGEFNQIRGVYDKLDCWMPPEVYQVFRRYFDCNADRVRDKYYELDARITREWGAIIESLKELKLQYTNRDIEDFRSLARSTQPESKFRAQVRGKVKRLYDNAVKVRTSATTGKKTKEQPTMTLRDLIDWFQTPRPHRPRQKR